jgi:hypothetical protein
LQLVEANLEARNHPMELPSVLVHCNSIVTHVAVYKAIVAFALMESSELSDKTSANLLSAFFLIHNLGAATPSSLSKNVFDFCTSGKPMKSF